MNIERLRSRGWSEQEIAHAMKIFATAETHPSYRRMEKVGFWMLIALLVSGSIGAVIMLLPFFVFSSLVYSIPIVFLLGACMGLFLIHVVHDLKLERTHQHIGVLVLVAATVILITFILQALEQRFGETPTLAVALPITFGILLPYIIHWRVTHETG